jgi:hypothetical protein
MCWAARVFFSVCLLSIGFLLGSHLVRFPSSALAQGDREQTPTAIRERLRETSRVLAETMQLLQEERRYVPAIQGLNSFATSVGGVDALADLESGRGVDPETFAGLVAGQAVAEVAEHLSHDAEGHLTYKNKVVRMYNASRLRQLFVHRGDLGPGAATPVKKVLPKKQEAAAPPAGNSPR